MAIKIKSLRESVADNGLKVLAHGPAGTGKTVMSVTTGEKTLLINAEGGLLSVKDAPGDIDVVEIKKYEDLEELYEDLTNFEHPYKWVNLDSISEIAEVCLAAEKKATKDGRKAYGEMADKMFEMLRKFRDLPHVNVFMTAKQSRFTDEKTGITTYYPSFPGKQLSENISYMFDEVFAMQVMKDEDGDLVYYVQTHRTPQFEAKDRSGKLDDLEEPHLGRIYKKIHGSDDGKSKKDSKVEAKEKAPAGKEETSKTEKNSGRKLNLGKGKGK